MKCWPSRAGRRGGARHAEASNVLDAAGEPLLFASARNGGSDAIIRSLYEHGARLDVPDNVGRTPLTWAGGVFLATHAPEAKPSTIALIKELLNAAESD